MKSTDKRLTTVRIDDSLFQEFKYRCVKDKFSFQKLASRAIFLYLTNKEFRKKIQLQTNTRLKTKNQNLYE
tara:strand:- start:341 stop:553 length:213 start_codon:yes stop_codon:yes gene_type:complete